MGGGASSPHPSEKNALVRLASGGAGVIPPRNNHIPWFWGWCDGSWRCDRTDVCAAGCG